MDHIGKRLTIRLHDSRGGYRDIVGILESASSLRHKDGHEITFSQDEISIYREIIPLPDKAGKGAPLTIRVIELEKILNSTWIAAEEKMLGKWLMRASGKYTMRANSVLPLGAPPFGEPEKEIDQAINEVVSYYQDRKIAPVFHLPLPIYEELADYLLLHGWIEKLRAQVQIIDITFEDITSESRIEVSTDCTQEWSEIQGDERLLSLMERSPARYYILKRDNVAVAVARAGIFEEWAVITRFYVKPDFRGLGIGQEMMAQIFNDLHARKITKAALQVNSENEPAIALYRKLGFRKHHEYSYLIRESDL